MPPGASQSIKPLCQRFDLHRQSQGLKGLLPSKVSQSGCCSHACRCERTRVPAALPHFCCCYRRPRGPRGQCRCRSQVFKNVSACAPGWSGIPRSLGSPEVRLPRALRSHFGRQPATSACVLTTRRPKLASKHAVGALGSSRASRAQCKARVEVSISISVSVSVSHPVPESHREASGGQHGRWQPD